MHLHVASTKMLRSVNVAQPLQFAEFPGYPLSYSRYSDEICQAPHKNDVSQRYDYRENKTDAGGKQKGRRSWSVTCLVA